MSLPAVAAPGRFRLLRRLGAGAGGEVSLAEDREHPGGPVALKRVRSSAAAWRAARREFSRLARLRHPHLMRVLDFGRLDDGALFLTSEYVDGAGLGAWAAGRGEVELGQALVQVGRALEYLHGQGVIHGDVKPDNILVQDGPRVVLVDFGVAAAVSGGRSASLSGTVSYLAPEVLAGGPRTTAADLFSLGVTLREVLPEGSRLGELARWLMAERADERPRGAAQLIQAVGQRLELDLELQPSELGGLYFPVAPFVGRDEILPLLEGAEPGVVLLRGDEGVGKSRLLEELRIRWLLGGVRCLCGRQGPLGGPLHQVAAALELERRPGGERDLEPVIDRLLDRLSQEATAGPVCLLLDGVTAEDSLSLKALDRLRSAPLRCLAAVRTGDWGPRHQPLLGAGARLVELPGLGAGELRELLGRLLPDHEHTPERLDEIGTATLGNPGLVEELLRAALEAGQILPGKRQYRLEVERASLRALARKRLGRLDAEGHAALRALAVFVHGAPSDLVPGRATLEQRGLVVEQQGLLRVNRWLRQELLDRLTPTERRTRHDEAARALQEHPGPGGAGAALRELELAEQLEGAGETRAAGARFAAVARTLLEGFDPGAAIPPLRRALALMPEGSPEASELLVELGQQHRRSGEWAEAEATHLRLCGTSAADLAALELAETRLAAGRPAEALAELRARPALEQGSQALRRSSLLARGLIQQGEYAAAEEQACLGLGAEAIDETTRADLENMLGLCRMMQSAEAEALPCFDRALAIHRSRGDVGGTARTMNSRGLALQRSGDLVGAALAYRQCLELARKAGDRQLQTIYCANAGTAAQQLRRPAEALSWYREGLALAQALCNERDLARLSVNLGNLMVQLGDLVEAQRLLDRGLELAGRLCLRDLQGHGWLFAAEAAQLRGERGRAVELGLAAAARFEELGLDSALAEARLLLARVHFEQADLVAARRWLQQAGGGLGAALLPRARALEAELQLRGPQPDRASARLLLEEALLRARQAGVPELLPELHLALADQAELLGDREEQRRCAALAIRDLENAVPTPYQSSFRLTHLSPLLARAGPLPEARAAAGTAELLRINRELAREHDPAKVLELILDRAVDLTGAERGFVILKGQDDDALRVAVARNIDQQAIRRKSHKFSRSVAERVVATGEPVVTPSAVEDRRFNRASSVHEMQLRSVICVPLQLRDQILGALYLDNRFRADAFGEQQVAELQAFADQATIALANARLVDELARRNQELEETRRNVEALNARLQATVVDQADQLEAISARLGSEEEALFERYRTSNLVARSKAMAEILRLVDRVAPTDVPVLLQGETGTGKESLAKAVHQASRRRTGPFISVNCAAIPAALLESELFGHARGAFTGAVRDTAGLFQASSGGTLLLDEIGDMPLEMQAKLLRVLQEGRYRRVGEEQERSTDVRLLSASLHDLAGLVAAGRFRQDLYYRLNVVPIMVPPLRQRPEDIPDLAAYFLDGIRPRPKLRPTALALLLRYHWPGNIRELQNELRRAAALSEGDIDAGALSPRLRQLPVDSSQDGQLHQVLQSAERAAIERGLDRCSGSVTGAARELGISRVVLHRKIRRHGIVRRR